MLATCQQIYIEARAVVYAQPYTFTLAMPQDSASGESVLNNRHEQPMGILLDCAIQPNTFRELKEVTLQIRYALGEAGKVKLYSPKDVEQGLSYFCEVLRETLENICRILNEGQRTKKLQQMNPAPGESLMVAHVAGAFNGIMAALRPLVPLGRSCDVSVTGSMGIGNGSSHAERRGWITVKSEVTRLGELEERMRLGIDGTSDSKNTEIWRQREYCNLEARDVSSSMAICALALFIDLVTFVGVNK
ncbi:MAG: hypothetical protein M1830_002471 [Pleopsidium flavum]|nr:MAG: hypothetical protein M1830_002471 [Pleopsidium flavum]